MVHDIGLTHIIASYIKYLEAAYDIMDIYNIIINFYHPNFVVNVYYGYYTHNSGQQPQIDYLLGGLEHVFFLYFHILGIIIPTDSYFSEGWLNYQPVINHH